MSIGVLPLPNQFCSNTFAASLRHSCFFFLEGVTETRDRAREGAAWGLNLNGVNDGHGMT